ncbi:MULTISPECIES: MFS transporter [unclassified Arsukibacterium]|uniref:MFS transporter n=1 Tax=unclassified Arsukibacterium TaxID=2635278 RepID=UPI000C8DF8B8|nr:MULTISPECIES: MFS transporter [unclassified Arsukibacterium]MAA94352.1 antiporter [Rheinheimera sp.]HAW91916.1 antiporter [Candidatus Azambacteria bacterium]|tara:strand:- start:2702 stop:4318 length:1617 start_codon:yes stop_codon:yes gene_type:complete
MSDLKQWQPEDDNFWHSRGKAIANRNLWISIPSLLCGFGVWMLWSIVTVQMLNVGYPFSTAELFTLTAIAGLTGATLRIPSSFFVRLCGGRYTLFLTTSLLLIPAVGTGLALQSIDTPLWVFQLMALLSGIGGGNFASSMSNISFFFPKKQQGLALGLNAGLGNFGVTTVQILVPLFMSYGVFTLLGGGEPMILAKASGTVTGTIPAGTETWIQNAGFAWLITLIPLAFLLWFGTNNIHTEEVTPKLPSAAKSFSIILTMLGIGFITSIAGLWLILPESANGSGFGIPKEIVLIAILFATVFLLKLLPGAIRTSLDRQYKIFNNKHTWVMSVLYVMTFGSFIGFAAAFPLSIKVIFGYSHIMVDGVMTHSTPNPNGPSALTYAWIAPFVGALIRPVGGWIADKLGGAFVTQLCSVVMVLCALGAAYYMQLAYQSATPEQYFVPFFLIFLGLFAASGIGNGSTFRTIAVVFPKEQAGPVLGWTSAVAAYGAFYIPQVLGEQIKAATPEYAMVGFAIFYSLCLLVNWFFYLRKNGEFYNP